MSAKTKKRKPAPVKVTTSAGVETVPASRFRRKPTYEFSLSAEQRSALFRGEQPRITVPTDSCPFEPGDVYDIPGTKNLSIGIEGIAVGGNGLSVVVYRVFDERPRLLRASVHGVDFDSIRRSMDSRGVPAPLTDAAAVEKAAEESGYTTSPGAALSGEPEAISRHDQEELATAAREKRERQIRHPITVVEEALEKLAEDPLYSQHGSTVRFLSNRVSKLRDDRLREEGVE